jgi:uncharacterized protein with PIN domain
MKTWKRFGTFFHAEKKAIQKNFGNCYEMTVCQIRKIVLVLRGAPFKKVRLEKSMDMI